jgi:hypothetical protein
MQRLQLQHLHHLGSTFATLAVLPSAESHIRCPDFTNGGYEFDEIEEFCEFPVAHRPSDLKH